MSRPFPPCELSTISLTIEMFTNPCLEGDQALLRQIRDTEALNKNERLYNLGVGEKDLASAAKFAALLEAEEIEVDMKPGKPFADGKPRSIPALAKTDEFMQELLCHDDERIRDLAQARLDVKSTINETRSGRMLAMAERGPLAVYLHYAGAHTRRWSGGDALNFQNLGRTGDLRKAIRAPDGYLLACPDQSQGECRILNWLAGQKDVVERFRRGDDPYLPMASTLYGRLITDKKAPERVFGKEVELACGFGMGPGRLASRLKAKGLKFEPTFPSMAVDAYRSSHPQVKALWREADLILHDLANGKRQRFWRILKIDDGCLIHPNGTWLDYSSLKWVDGEWRLYGRNGSWSRMYGAKLVENVVQWLSRIVTAEAMVKFAQAGIPIVGMAHDDVWLLIRDNNSNWPTHDRDAIVSIMSETPSWAPGLPLSAECKIGKTYS
jgi:DNA polymerase family A